MRRLVGGVKRRLGGGLSIVVMGAVELMLEACQWDLVREVVWRLFGTSPVPGWESPKWSTAALRIGEIGSSKFKFAL